MYQYYLSLGMSKDGDFRNIEKAFSLLKAYRATKFLNSEFYLACRTVDQERVDFFNACLYMDSQLNPFEFMEKIKKIERRISNTEIQIVWISGIEILSNRLRVPDDKMMRSTFVIEPLLEVAKSDGRLLRLIKHNNEQIKEKAKRISRYNLRRM